MIPSDNTKLAGETWSAYLERKGIPADEGGIMAELAPLQITTAAQLVRELQQILDYGQHMTGSLALQVGMTGQTPGSTVRHFRGAQLSRPLTQAVITALENAMAHDGLV